MKVTEYEEKKNQPQIINATFEGFGNCQALFVSFFWQSLVFFHPNHPLQTNITSPIAFLSLTELSSPLVRGMFCYFIFVLQFPFRNIYLLAYLEILCIAWC